MPKYVVQTEKMNEVMSLLFRVLDIRITFFDLQESELDDFEIKKMSPFCHYYRTSNPEFEKKCIECDHKNLEIAMKTGNVHVYHCHANLLEGIVPLYDKRGMYLGAIVFGQLRDKDIPYKKTSKKAENLLTKTKFMTRQEVYDIGVLLKHIGENIIENEVIKHQNKPWTERVERYITEHINEKLTIARLAKYIDRSPSFLSHNFPKEFGISLKAYIQKKKMKQAQKLLESGLSVKQTAFELGFYDEFHFSKKFKSFYGKPPVEFKSQ
jgi:AraC-like DNA-binding protein